MKHFYSVAAQGFHDDLKLLMDCDVKDITEDKVIDVVRYFIEKGMSVINIEYEYGVDENDCN